MRRELLQPFHYRNLGRAVRVSHVKGQLEARVINTFSYLKHAVRGDLHNVFHAYGDVIRVSLKKFFPEDNSSLSKPAFEKHLIIEA